jgi:hypothetical protein
MRIEQILAEADPFGAGPMPFPLPGNAGPLPAGGGEAGAITTLIRTFGLDGALDALGLPPAMKRDIKELEHRMGKDAVIDSLIAFMEMMGGMMGGGGPPLPKPPPRGSGAPKHAKPKPPRSGEPDPDDPFPDQLDLFR